MSKIIGEDVSGPYYIEVKIVTGGILQLNDNLKIIEVLKEHGFVYQGEPVTQSNSEVSWTFMEKNVNLIDK